MLNRIRPEIRQKDGGKTPQVSVGQHLDSLLEYAFLRVRRDAVGFKGSQIARDLFRVVDSFGIEVQFTRTKGAGCADEWRQR